MPKLKLTDPFIRNHPEPEKRLEIYDKHTSGLAVRITPTGSKSFVYRYRFNDKVKRYTIGKYPKIRLAEAREEAGELAYQVSKGIDPLAEKQKRKYQPDKKNFKELATDFKERHLPTLRESTREEYKRIIENELEPKLKSLAVTDITSHRLRKLLDDKAIKDESPTMANRIRAVLSSMFDFATKKIGIKLNENPVKGTSTYKAGENKRDRVYDGKEIRKLWGFIDHFEEPIQSVFKMLLITGQRKTETMRMKWKDISKVKENGFEGMVWTIPAKDAKNKKEHEVPLSDMALQIIEKMRPITGDSDYIFESPRKENQPLKWIKSSSRKIKLNTDVSDFRPHDLRRTVATFMAEIGINPMIIGKVLNHKGLAQENTITARYNRATYLEQKQEALNRWSWKLDKILKDEDANVTKIA